MQRFQSLRALKQHQAMLLVAHLVIHTQLSMQNWLALSLPTCNICLLPFILPQASKLPQGPSSGSPFSPCPNPPPGAILHLHLAIELEPHMHDTSRCSGPQLPRSTDRHILPRTAPEAILNCKPMADKQQQNFESIYLESSCPLLHPGLHPCHDALDFYTPCLQLRGSRGHHLTIIKPFLSSTIYS